MASSTLVASCSPSLTATYDINRPVKLMR